jgi:tight adherence protein B
MMLRLAALLLIVGGAMLLAVVLTGRTRERALVRRTDLIAPASRQIARRMAGRARRTRVLDRLRLLFAFRMRRSWGVAAAPGQLLLLAIGGAAALSLLGRFALRQPAPIAALCGAMGFFLVPRIILIREQRRADRRFAELLPDAIDMVVRVVRAGLPVGAAIRTVGQEGDPPLRLVFARIAAQTEIGVPLEQALANVAAALGNADFRFFAVAVALQQATGGNLAATLETLSQIIRKRRAVRLKAGSATAEVRLSAIILGSIPFVVTALLLLVAPHYLDPLFHDRRGNFILGGALLCLVLAGVTMRAMIRRALAT